jgi:hypothetical protein
VLGEGAVSVEGAASGWGSELVLGLTSPSGSHWRSGFAQKFPCSSRRKRRLNEIDGKVPHSAAISGVAYSAIVWPSGCCGGAWNSTLFIPGWNPGKTTSKD